MVSAYLIRSIVSPLCSLSLFVLCSASFMTFFNLQLSQRGYGEIVIAVINSAFYAGYLIGSWRAEHLIRRIGYIRAFTTFANIYAASIMIQGLFDAVTAWIAMRCIAGICASALFIAIESWLLLEANVHNRGKILSLYMIVFYAMQSLGQLLVAGDNPPPLLPFLQAGLLCALSVLPVAITDSNAPSVSEELPQIGLQEIFTTSPLGFWGCFVGGMLLSSIYTFVPKFAHDQHLSASHAMALTISGGLLLQWPIGYLSDRCDRGKILVLTSSTILLPSIAIILFRRVAALVMGSSFFLGGLCFTLYPLSIAQICERSGGKNVAQATAVCSFAYGLGSVVGPLGASLLMQKSSSTSLYLFIALVSTLLPLLARRRPRRSHRWHRAAANQRRETLLIPLLESRREDAETVPLPSAEPLLVARYDDL